ncbi:unnamed protein product [Arabis nemorensis]|uniref:DCD domain-containing protein n=1 Tax=Arabis nemorensis TaxID=586526 RepID=A0A565CVA6_9BRAS|nr:unnamed protein product [Arabis nemorensis]
MAEAMETEMDFSDGEQTKANAQQHGTISQYSAPPVYNRSGLMPVYGNPAIGLENVIERRHDHEQLLPGYIFMCNGRTKPDCYRYRVFGIPRGRKDVVESIKPGMKLFLYDFEKRLLYGVYEATIGGKLDIEPEAFDKKYPAQVGFRIVKNCYPLPENTFKSAICENYKGGKFKQELAPHQVMSLLSLFRSFTAPELDALPHRLASRALSFEERFIAATQLRNASSVLDPLFARHAEPRLGSLMAHQSVPRTPLLQHSYSRQDDYATPVREESSLSNLNQPYYPTENRQQQLLGEPSRSSIQDPQLKYLTILSNIRRYGTAPERLASENEYHPATPSEKDQFASPYSDSKYYPSMLSGNEHPSASAANGSVYRSEFHTLASQKEGEASQQGEIPADTYYHPEASTVPNTTVSMQSDMQAISVAQSHTTETAVYSIPPHGETPQPAAGATGYIHQLQSVAGNYATHSQPGSVEESTQSYAGTVSHPQHQYHASLGHATQLYAGGGTGYTKQPHEIGYAQQPHAAATGYTQQPHTAGAGYAQQPHAAATGYAQQLQAAATEYAQQLQAAATEYAQQPHVAATEYAQQPHAVPTGYAKQLQAAATEYAQQPHAAPTGYAQQPHAKVGAYTLQYHAQAVGYTPQYHAQAGAYTQQAVMQPGAPGTAGWNAASQAYSTTGDWNAVDDDDTEILFCIGIAGSGQFVRVWKHGLELVLLLEERDKEIKGRVSISLAVSIWFDYIIAAHEEIPQTSKPFQFPVSEVQFEMQF